MNDNYNLTSNFAAEEVFKRRNIGMSSNLNRLVKNEKVKFDMHFIIFSISNCVLASDFILVP